MFFLRYICGLHISHVLNHVNNRNSQLSNWLCLGWCLKSLLIPKSTPELLPRGPKLGTGSFPPHALPAETLFQRLQLALKKLTKEYCESLQCLEASGPRSRCQQGWSLLRPLSLACGWTACSVSSCDFHSVLMPP